MKIVEVRAFQPETPGSPPDWRTQLGQIVVEVVTDAGLTGIGVGGGGAASVHVIHTVLSDLLVGQDATEVEQLHQAMCAHTSFYGRVGLVVMAISGVDLALWDLRGKTAETPVARLLNSEVDFDRPLPTYVTVFDDVATREAMQRGHSAVKLHVERFGDRPDPSELARLIEAARGQLGPEAMLMLDAFARWDVETTLRVADAIERFDVAWIEEPLPPDQYDDYERLVASSPVPIAGGEHEYLAAGFKRLIDGRLHAILQPDINWCGGLTTLIDIYKMAAEAGLRVCPHRGCEPYALHAIAALDPEPLAESARTWFRCLDGAPEIEGGQIRVSRNAGFGIRAN